MTEMGEKLPRLVNKVPSWFPDIHEQYTNADNWIGRLKWASWALIVICVFSLEWGIRNDRSDMVFQIFSTMGVLVSVLIITYTASRAISFQQILYNTTKDAESVTNLHHAIILVGDLIVRVDYHRKMVGDPRIRVVGFAKSARKIEDRLDALMARELYRTLPGDIATLMQAISGSVFGLANETESIRSCFSDSAFLREAEQAGFNIQPERFDVLVGDLQKLQDILLREREAMETDGNVDAR